MYRSLSVALATVLLLLITGCALHRPMALAQLAPAPPDPIMDAAKRYVTAVAGKMPEWDADQPIASYEAQEIARVKADIRAAQDAEPGFDFMRAASRLRYDFEALIELDQRLRSVNLL
jgi:hypothetical protein